MEGTLLGLSSEPLGAGGDVQSTGWAPLLCSACVGALDLGGSEACAESSSALLAASEALTPFHLHGPVGKGDTSYPQPSLPLSSQPPNGIVTRLKTFLVTFSLNVAKMLCYGGMMKRGFPSTS